MTSIITFKIDSGEKMIVVGDTQHTFDSTTSEEEKIFFFGDFLYCGAGFDRIISSIYLEIKEMDNLSDCADKIIESINNKYLNFSQSQIYGISSEDVRGTEIILINTKTLEGYYIFGGQKTELKRVEVIGSGQVKKGEITNKYNQDFTTSLSVKQDLFKKILKTFHDLGKNLPSTGHPAVFKLEGYILEKDKSPKKFNFHFKHDLEDLNHYEVIEDD